MTRYTYCPLCATKLVEQRIEHSLKQSCNRPECSFVHWENPTPVVLLLVELNEHYIVTHNLAWPKWKYSLISGFVDARESPEQTAVREIKEELNLETLSLQLITVSLYEKLNQLMISLGLSRYQNSSARFLQLKVVCNRHARG